MATGTWKWYKDGVFRLHAATLGNLRVAITTSSHTPLQDTHDAYDDLTNEVANGNGYTTGGKALTNPTLTYNSGTNVWMLDADDMTGSAGWPTSTFTGRNIHLYDSGGGSSATDYLIGFCTLDGDVTSAGGTWELTFNASGILTYTLA